ncbi:hypothetical protein [Halegenticoccus tardaugens]|uniref:hypothetical protein n=1 Tax=Halegenticoccus tardaugens TaxID=2071624 RepID=UPI00100A55B0|nr:hypothetical protein [Halegenticoccus tardaugens]
MNPADTVTSGGTSVGAGDHMGRVLADHKLLFSGVAPHPGWPLTTAMVDETLVCASSEQPLAAQTAATLVVRPAFTSDVNASLPTVRVDPTHWVELPDPPFEYAIPASIEDRQASRLGHVDSSVPVYEERFASERVASSTRLTLADGVVVTTEPFVRGDPVEIVPHEVVE